MIQLNLNVYREECSDDDLQGYSLGNQLMQYFVEEVFTQPVTEVGKGAIGRGLEEVKAAEETKPGIVAQG